MIQVEVLSTSAFLARISRALWIVFEVTTARTASFARDFPLFIRIHRCEPTFAPACAVVISCHYFLTSFRY
jgi:hypothetical protein